MCFLAAIPLILDAGFGGEDFLLAPREGRAWGSATWSYLTGLDPESHAYWRPATRVVQQTLQVIVGTSGVAFHAWNLLLHICATAVFFRLATRLSGDRTVGAFTALVFLIHPAHAEPVVWISGISGLSESLVHLVGLLAFDMYLVGGARRWGAVAAVCFPVALLFKESAATMLLTIPVLWMYRRGNWRRMWPWATMCLSAAAIWAWRGAIGVQSSVSFEHLTPNPLGWIRNVLYYIVQSLAPVRSIFRVAGFDNYYRWRDAMPAVPDAWLYTVAVIVLALAGVALGWRYGRRLPRCVRWSPVFAVAVMGPLLPLRHTGMRLMYLYCGFIVLGVAGAALSRRRGAFVRWGLVAWLAILSVSWVEQAESWRESGKLAGRVFAEAGKIVTESPNGSALAFRGVPARHLGGFIFPVAFSEALRQHYPDGGRWYFNFDDPHEDPAAIPAGALWFEWDGARFAPAAPPNETSDTP